jgi:hypothetical protein
MLSINSIDGDDSTMPSFIEKHALLADYWVSTREARDDRKAGSNGFAVGLGLTNECNLACAHGYRDTGCVDLHNYEQFWSGFQRLLELCPLAVWQRTHHARDSWI